MERKLADHESNDEIMVRAATKVSMEMEVSSRKPHNNIMKTLDEKSIGATILAYAGIISTEKSLRWCNKSVWTMLGYKNFGSFAIVGKKKRGHIFTIC